MDDECARARSCDTSPSSNDLNSSSRPVQPPHPGRDVCPVSPLSIERDRALAAARRRNHPRALKR